MEELPRLKHYRFFEKLAEGAWAKVYLAENALNGLRCAIKVFEARPRAEQHFGAELQTLARLEHPNLAKVIDFGRCTGTDQPFIALEYVKGLDFVSGSRNVSRQHFLSMIVQVCRALQYLQSRGVTHGDLKPQNLLVTSIGSLPLAPPTVKLVDFGYACTDSDRSEWTSSGSPEYLAPEVIRGHKPTTASDLYSLGVILYECLAGTTPFHGRDTGEILQKHLAGAPPRIALESLRELHPLIYQLLVPDPMRRNQSPREIVRFINSLPDVGYHRLEDVGTWSAQIRSCKIVGRDNTLSGAQRLLSAFLSDQATSKPHCILIIGGRGSGKTRVANEIVLEAALMGYQPFNFALDSSDQISDDRPAASGHSPDGDSSRSMIVVYDGLHGPSAIAQFEALRKWTSQSNRLCLVVTTIDSSSAPFDTLQTVERSAQGWMDVSSWPLAPLNEQEVRALILDAMSSKATDRQMVRDFFNRSGGNPSLLCQLLVAAIDQGTLDPHREMVSLRGSLDALRLPESTTQQIHECFGILSMDESEVLNVLALSDDELNPSDLALLLDRQPFHLEQICLRLAYRGLLTAAAATPPSRYRLSNSLFRDRAIAIMQPERKQVLYETLALWYHSQADRADAVERAALCFIGADRKCEAFNCSLRAAQMASENANHEQAVRFYRLALETSPSDEAVRAEVVLDLSTAYFRLGDFLESKNLLDSVVNLSDLPPLLKARIQLAIARWASGSGEMKLSEQAGRAAFSIAEAAGLEEEAILSLNAVGSALCCLEEQDAGRRMLFRAALRARRAGWREIAGQCLHLVAYSHWRKGNYLLALRYVQRRRRLCRERRDVVTETNELLELGVLQLDLGFYRRSLRSCSSNLEKVRSLGMKDIAGRILNNIGETYRARGRWRSAITAYSEVANVAAAAGNHMLETLAEENLGNVLSRSGHHVQGLSYLKHTLRESQRLGSSALTCGLVLVWASLLSELGRFDLAQRCIAFATRLAEAGHSWRRMLELRTLLANALCSCGRAAEAQPLLTEGIQKYGAQAPFEVRLAAHLAALRIERLLGAPWDSIREALEEHQKTARSKGMDWHLACALMIASEAMLAANVGAEAEAGLIETIKIARKNADRTMFWQASYLLGRVYEQMLRYERARSCYRAAALTVQELAMNLEEERFRESFLNIPRVKEVLERYERLTGEVGRQARHDLAAMNRSEKISRKMIGALSEIGQKLTSILNLDELLRSVLDLAIENVRAERGIVFLQDETTGEMRQACGRGIDRDDLEEVSTFSRSVIKRVAQGQSVLTVDVGKDQELSAYKSLTLHEIKSILAVPMRARGVVVGVIYLDTRRASQLFTEKERAFVESFAGQAAIAIENARLFGTMNAENTRLRREVEGRTRFEELIGESPAMRKLRETIASVVDIESNVLILGESGTGKELVARAIHYNGPRQKKKFVAIDCGSLPESLLEAELFGYARGAFTGADRERIGLIEGARGGTLFLDEITNTSLALQSRLLRVLQEREVRRIGENEPRPIDVRIIAATNADIKGLMDSGRFRQDLFYRLNVVTLEVPPVRERREDIPLLMDRFLKAHAREGRPLKRLAPGVMAVLGRHDWPGNVREIQNLVEGLVVLSPTGVISIDDLPEGLRPGKFQEGHGSDGDGRKNGEQMMIEDALRRHGGDKAKAARFIGWHRQKLYRRMKLLGIPADFGQAA